MDPQRGAAADDDPSQRAQSGRRRRDGQDRLALRVRPRHRRADLADRGTSGPEERDAGRTELADAAVSDQARRRSSSTRSASTTSVPYLPPEEAETFKQRLLAADNKGIFTPISLKDTVHVPTSNGGTLFGGAASEPRTGAVYVVAHENPGILRLLRPGETAGRGGGAPPVPAGTARVSAELPGRATARIGWARRPAPPLVYATADPANNIAAGAPRFDAAAIRAGAGDRQGPDARVPAPHQRRRR